MVFMATSLGANRTLKAVNFGYEVWHKWGGQPNHNRPLQTHCRNDLQNGGKFEFSYGLKGSLGAMMLTGTKMARLTAALMALAALVGCASERPPPPPVAAAPPPPPPKPVPPVDMAGRWTFAAANGGRCAMTFGGSTGGSEGTIAPAGGCPGNFFTSRKWTYEPDTLVIRDHKGQPLARLAFAPPDSFSGPATGGATVSLAR
jgi:hypothetical protein